MQLAPVEGPLQAGEIPAAKDRGQGADRKEEAGMGGNPARAVWRERAAGHDAVHMHVLRERLAPGVEDGGHAELPAQVPGIAAEAQERGGRGLKEQTIEQARVALRQRVERVRQREDDVKVRNRQDLAPAGGQPALGGHALALGAMAVAARVVGDPLGAARCADGAMAPEGRGAARRDRTQGAALSAAQRMGALIRRAVSTDDVSELDPGPPLSADPHGGRRRRGHASGSGRLGQIERRAGGEHVPRREVQIARGGGEVAMAEQVLDRRQIAAGLEQVGGEGVAVMPVPA